MHGWLQKPFDILPADTYMVHTGKALPNSRTFQGKCKFKDFLSNKFARARNVKPVKKGLKFNLKCHLMYFEVPY